MGTVETRTTQGETNMYGTKEFYTAKEMALTPHNLSRDGMMATMADGKVYKWSESFQVFAGPFPKCKGAARRPAQKAA
jgi:hypothetical protein